MILGTLFTITEENILAITGYMGNVFEDVSPLFFLITGLTIGFWIIKNLISLIKSE